MDPGLVEDPQSVADFSETVLSVDWKCGHVGMRTQTLASLPGAVQKASKKLEMHVYSKRLEVMLQ